MAKPTFTILNETDHGLVTDATVVLDGVTNFFFGCDDAMDTISAHVWLDKDGVYWTFNDQTRQFTVTTPS